MLYIDMSHDRQRFQDPVVPEARKIKTSRQQSFLNKNGLILLSLVIASLGLKNGFMAVI